jgi:uncharacterized repeat protein (TIGR02543 family)
MKKLLYIVSLVTLFLTAGLKAWATDYTTTYIVSGSANGNSVTMSLSASGNGNGTYSQSWTKGTDSFIRIVCEGNNYLEITNPSKDMTVINGNTFKSTGSTTFVYRNASSSYRIKHVQLYYDNNLIVDSYNIGRRFEYTLSLLAFNRVIVTYTDTQLPIDESVFSGLAASYRANGRGVKPVPKVTWNGLVLTEGTHYTLSYADNYTGGNHDATITATGMGDFTGTTSVTFAITEVTLNMFTQNGDGSYRISSADDLGLLSALTTGGNSAEGVTFKQTCDIAFPYTNAWNDDTGKETNFYPIKPFHGSYDGQGHTISGIRMYFPTYTQNEDLGLFGSTSGNTTVTIKNINLRNSRFTGYHSVGGIVGSVGLKTTVEDCCAGEDVAFYAVTTGSSQYGGIAGYDQGSIIRCISHAKFSRAGSASSCKQWGGVVGHTSSGRIKYCLAIGVTMPSVNNRGAIAGSVGVSSPGNNNYYMDCTIGSASSNVGYSPYSSGSGAVPTDKKGEASLARAVIADSGVTIGPYTGSGRQYTTGYFGITGYERYPDSSGHYGHLSYNGTVYAGATENITLSLTHVDAPEGYTFGSFTTSGTGGETLQKYYGNYYYLTVGTDDITISNVWTPHTYTVTFDKNHEDATGTMDSQAFTYDMEQNLTANAFSRVDYSFVGWNTAPDGSGTSYSDGASVSNLTAEDNGNVTLYAQWKMTGYYNLNLPSDPAGTVTAKVGDNENVTMAHINNTVTITITPAAGHRLTPDSVTAKYTDAESNIQTLSLTQDPQDATKYSFIMPDFEVTISASFQNLDWLALGEAFAAASTDAENPTVITLTQDYTAASGDTYLFLDKNHHLVLDLNGHTINRNLSAAVANGHVLESKQNTTLIIRDSSPGHTGTVTGGWSTVGCGGLSTQGTTRLEGGTITGNRVNGAGGSAVRFSGNLYITGCTITGNKGNLKGNSAIQAGAVYGSGGENARLYISGGAVITGNYVCRTQGGSAGLGFYCGIGYGQVHLSGTYTLSGNMQGTYDAETDSWSNLQPSDYHVTDRYRLYLDSAIYPTAPSVLILEHSYYADITRGWSTMMSGRDPEDYFILAPYVTDKGLGIDSNGEAVICTPHDIDVNGNATASKSSCVQGKRITLIPGKGKVITSARYTPEGESPIDITPSNGVFAFTMPDAKVIVDVTCEDGNTIVLVTKQGTFDGQSKYWCTFYNGTERYVLPNEATAYTMSSSKQLYRLGTDGKIIPAGVAVVIISDMPGITLTLDGGSTPVTVNGGGNILQGSDSDVTVSGLSGTPHVLSVSAGTIGFRQFTGTSIPAGKAYYVVTP